MYKKRVISITLTLAKLTWASEQTQHLDLRILLVTLCSVLFMEDALIHRQRCMYSSSLKVMFLEQPLEQHLQLLHLILRHRAVQLVSHYHLAHQTGVPSPRVRTLTPTAVRVAPAPLTPSVFHIPQPAPPGLAMDLLQHRADACGFSLYYLNSNSATRKLPLFLLSFFQ